MTSRVPHHIAIIMDGNGRWAQKKNLPRIKGHEKGAKVVEKIIDGCLKLNIRYLTLFAFSMENWNRPKREVNHLMRYLAAYLDDKLPIMLDKNIRFNVIGRKALLPDKILKKIDRNIQRTCKNSKLTFTLALSYSGRSDIVDAAKKIAKQVKNNTLVPSKIDEKTIAENLSTFGIPDPDLLIRTSGEERISNFLLWELSYSELYFTPILWPDFSVKELEKAVNVYKKRNRRFGRI